MDLKGNLLFEKNTKIALPANSSHVQFSAPLETIRKGKSRNEVVVNARFTTADGKEPKT
jgi:beta-mannosidase